LIHLGGAVSTTSDAAESLDSPTALKYFSMNIVRQNRNQSRDDIFTTEHTKATKVSHSALSARVIVLNFVLFVSFVVR
jgi:hypothetical protein